MCVLPGDLIRDRYLIIKELGRGGWGVTYLAQDTQLPHNPDCVIKEITPSTAISLEANRERFEEEANALYTLGNHCQIPQLFARFEQNEKFYLIQEYIKGQNLHERFNLGYRFTQQEAIIFLLDILEVLKFVHEHQKIHRDLKPSNLIHRAEDGKIVLIDFGAVKELSGLEYTETGQVQSTIAIGTPGYMPAEQCFCSPRCNSDLYALGITTIRGITGLNPPTKCDNSTENTNSMQIDSATSEVIWQDLPNSTKLLSIDRKLETILNQMVRFNFSDRYQATEEVIRDLKQLIPQTSSAPSAPSSKKKLLGISVLTGLITGALLMKVMPPLLLAPKTQDRQIDFTEVCQSLTEEGAEFENYQGTPEHTNFKSSPMWTVFGWKCIFSNQEDTQIRGINLNDYCAKKYQKVGDKYEAYFKNYLDKNSWYCTNVGTKFENKKSELSLNDNVSFGEKILNPNFQLTIQQTAATLFSQEKYQLAIQKLQQSWQTESKDPQTLIYLNNALLELTESDYYTIAVIVPLSNSNPVTTGVQNKDLGNEILRGVAQAQTEINLGIKQIKNQLPALEYLSQKSIQGKGLKVLILNDFNAPQQVSKIASQLTNSSEILGVIGHYASDLTIEAIDLYNDNQTLLISPGSTSEELTQPHRPFFFRTIPTVSDNAEELANYLINKTQQKQAAIFYNPNSSFTRSMRKEFKQVFEAKGGKIVLEYEEFPLDNFDEQAAIKEVHNQQQDTAIVLFPDGQVTAAVNNAHRIIELNKGRNWIVGGATLYNPKTLSINNLQAYEKLVIAVPWHRLSSPNLKFTKDSQQLWQGNVNHRTALGYDAARVLIKALDSQTVKHTVTRSSLQAIIAANNFSTQGAIGTIRFTANGNRRKPFVELVTVAQCNVGSNKLAFIPLNYDGCL